LRETYLRITLNENQIDANGSSFVFEVWPGGHRSKIHNHSNQYAVVKVLAGEITEKLFSSLKLYY
jgi:hypothetical protein